MKVRKISTVFFNNYSNHEKINTKQNYPKLIQNSKVEFSLLNYQQSISFGMAIVPNINPASALFKRFSESFTRTDGDFVIILQELFAADKSVKKAFAFLTDEKGQTALHKMFLLPYNKKYFETDGIISQYWENVIGILSSKEKLKVFSIVDNKCNNIGHLSADNSYEAFEIFMKGINSLSKVDRIPILRAQNKWDENIGHMAANKAPEYLKIFMDTITQFSKERQTNILIARNKFGNTLGHAAAGNSSEVFKTFIKGINNLPVKLRIKLFTKYYNRDGKTVMQSLYNKNHEKYYEFAKNIADDESLSKEETIKFLQALNIDGCLDKFIAKVERFEE